MNFAGLIIGAVAAVSLMTIAMFMIGLYAVVDDVRKEMNAIRRVYLWTHDRKVGDRHEAD